MNLTRQISPPQLGHASGNFSPTDEHVDRVWMPKKSRPAEPSHQSAAYKLRDSHQVSRRERPVTCVPQQFQPSSGRMPGSHGGRGLAPACLPPPFRWLAPQRLHNENSTVPDARLRESLVLTSPDGREQLWLRRNADGKGGEILEVDGRLLPGVSGPPLHAHYQLSEETTVTSGQLGVLLDDVEFVMQPGETSVFPPGSKHRWWNAGNGPTEFSGRAVPAGDLDQYLQGVFALVNANPTGPPSFFHMAHLLWRHRHTHAVLSPPIVIQRLLLPLVISLGWLLGKYRGDSWPARPASCPGAPRVSHHEPTDDTSEQGISQPA
jgi:mannose-6-phosphate isomerase-like protein (cupin superfamily)